MASKPVHLNRKVMGGKSYYPCHLGYTTKTEAKSHQKKSTSIPGRKMHCRIVKIDGLYVPYHGNF